MFRVRDLRYLQFGPVSFELEAGRCLGVSGPSGSGKSTMLRALADLDPHEGETSLHGERCHSMPAHLWRRRVGYLPADAPWWEDMVGQHFTETPDLAALGFEADVMHWEVRRLSSGEKQRLGLLRMLAGKPEVLLLDEPTANLDPANAERVETLLRAQQAGRAMVLVSHDPAQLVRLAHERLELPG